MSLPMTKEPERSGGLAPEAVWYGWAGGLWRDHGQETLGSWPPTKTGSRRVGQTASGAWAGTAQTSERGMTVMRGKTVLANRH